jgi:hypothetical protein
VTVQPASLVSPDTIEALMAPGIDSTALQSLINRQEAWLARQIGPLVGERTQRIYVAPGDYDALILQRATDAVSVIDGDPRAEPPPTELDPSLVRLVGERRLEKAGPWSGPEVHATYTPTDELEVEEAVIDLCRIVLAASPYQTEASEGHSYTHSDKSAMSDYGPERHLIVLRFTSLGDAQTVRARMPYAPDRWSQPW